MDAFYNFWFSFKSWREFPHPDEEDIEQVLRSTALCAGPQAHGPTAAAAAAAALNPLLVRPPPLRSRCPLPAPPPVCQAESREHRRWIERYNSKLREKGKKEEFRRIRDFVESANRQDPR